VIDALEAFLADLLEARLAVCEMERTLLISEIDSPETTPGRRAEAIARRDAVTVNWGKLMTELCDLRRLPRSNRNAIQRGPAPGLHR